MDITLKVEKDDMIFPRNLKSYFVSLFYSHCI